MTLKEEKDKINQDLISTTNVPGSAAEGPPVRVADMGDENLSEDFKEILLQSSLSEKAKEAIQVISRGGTPSGRQIARPDLMKIIRFFMATYNCINDEMIRLDHY